VWDIVTTADAVDRETLYRSPLFVLVIKKKNKKLVGCINGQNRRETLTTAIGAFSSGTFSNSARRLVTIGTSPPKLIFQADSFGIGLPKPDRPK